MAVRGADARDMFQPCAARYCACYMTGTRKPPSWASRAEAKGQQPYTLNLNNKIGAENKNWQFAEM